MAKSVTTFIIRFIVYDFFRIQYLTGKFSTPFPDTTASEY